MNEGLTMIVGPPGTGKTDVAVQIINNLYHNFPGNYLRRNFTEFTRPKDTFDYPQQSSTESII